MWENNVCVGAVGAPALYLLADKDNSSKQDHRPANARLRVFQLSFEHSEFILCNELTNAHCDCSRLFLVTIENEYVSIHIRTCNLAVFPRKASREVAQTAKTRGNRLCQHQ